MAYGNCWTCGAPVVSRTRGIPTIDTCENGHKHDSSLTLRGKLEAEVLRMREKSGWMDEALREIEALCLLMKGLPSAAAMQRTLYVVQAIASAALGDGDKGDAK